MASDKSSLQCIAAADVQLGMFVHAFDGNWLDHPFWRTRFVLDDPRDLAKLRASSVRGVWIDRAQGRGAEAASAAAEAEPELALAAAAGVADGQPVRAASVAAMPADQPDELPLPPPAQYSLEASVDLKSEMDRAARVCQQARQVMDGLFREARLGHAMDAAHCEELVDEIAGSVFRNPGALIGLARLRSVDAYTHMHSVAVCALMIALGRTLGLDDAACREAGLAGLLHDMGKARVPLEILNKPGKLTDAEFEQIRRHPEHGHAMLMEGHGAHAAALDVCLGHHEKMDGTGYPHRRPAGELSQLVRMGAVCDVYDAITSHRPYKAGWDPAESLARMASWKGHFDTGILHAFVRSLGIYPNGALVRLESRRLAVVVEQRPNALTRPVVRTVFDLAREQALPPVEVDLSLTTTDRIVDREPLDRWNFPHLAEVWAGREALAVALG